MYLDIHSHILSGIDDGAEDLSVSLALLNDIYNQGITDIIATPHFFPMYDNLEDFLENRQSAFEELQNALKGKPHPNVYLGCELLYYNGLSYASSLENFTIENSKYILLEADYRLLNKKFFAEILHLKEIGFKPILAHIERYKKAKGFRKFIRFIKANGILTQVNATAFNNKNYNKLIKKLVKEDLITFVASDTHSIDVRPPMIEAALEKITADYGEEYAKKLISNSQILVSEIAKGEP
ncbi:MAG: hypothetical protein IJD45_02070 [Clostridia bacterium]|nr:hypothetical protein [Clostridia bacterium]